jgi:hypothetical protein
MPTHASPTTPKPAPRTTLLDRISGDRANEQDHDHSFVGKMHAMSSNHRIKLIA